MTQIEIYTFEKKEERSIASEKCMHGRMKRERRRKSPAVFDRANNESQMYT